MNRIIIRFLIYVTFIISKQVSYEKKEEQIIAAWLKILNH